MSYSDAPPADGLQGAVDRLAARLGRSVAVDDTHGRLVVSSRHFGDEDPLRTYALLQRDSDPRVMAHFAEHGVHGWTGPGRIPGNPELGFKARVGCPVRAHGIPFGHLFLIDDGVGDWEIDLAAAVADEVGVLLHRRLVLRDREHDRRDTVVRDLLSPDPDTRAAAARAVLAEHLADAVEPAAALTVRLPAGGPSPDTALHLALDGLTRDRSPTRPLATALGGEATVLLLGDRSAVGTGRAVATRLVDALRRGGVTGRVVVGLGAVADGPDAAHRSAADSRRVADAASLLPGLGDVVGPDDLGAYAVLLALPRPAATSELYPAGLRRLLGSDPGLVETLEVYLDRCGDATRTAAALHIHRSTLYYRLGRIETLAEVDLHDGHARLALHLGVKLRRVLDAYS